MLWVARDEGRDDDDDHWLFYEEPWKNADGSWTVGSYSRMILIPASCSPVKLEPGEGPVRMRLVVAEDQP